MFYPFSATLQISLWQREGWRPKFNNTARIHRESFFCSYTSAHADLQQKNYKYIAWSGEKTATRRLHPFLQGRKSPSLYPHYTPGIMFHAGATFLSCHAGFVRAELLSGLRDRWKTCLRARNFIYFQFAGLSPGRDSCAENPTWCISIVARDYSPEVCGKLDQGSPVLSEQKTKLCFSDFLRFWWVSGRL